MDNFLPVIFCVGYDDLVICINSDNNSLFLESLIPVICSFCHFLIISSKYVLNGVGERERDLGVLLY
jgi:hypothetical protein